MLFQTICKGERLNRTKTVDEALILKLLNQDCKVGVG